MRYKIFILFFCALVVFSISVAPVAAATKEEQIQVLQEQIKKLQALLSQLQLQPGPQNQVAAGSYLAMDISSGSIISEKNSGKTYPIASITKLMNAVITKENTNLDKTIMLTRDMLRPEGHSPSLFLNLEVSAKNLLKAMLMQSTNDAAQSLSYGIGNDKFIELMNQKTSDLGMQNTHFYDVHGLNPKNHSTASDLAKLITYIYKNHPDLLAITKTDDFWLPDPTGKLLKFKNVNNFHDSKDFIGGKTGYLPEARQTMAALFNINEKPTAIIVLYSKNRQTDILKIIEGIKKERGD